MTLEETQSLLDQQVRRLHSIAKSFGSSIEEPLVTALATVILDLELRVISSCEELSQEKVRSMDTQRALTAIKDIVALYGGVK